MTRPVIRFAPSPNGRLHLGHAYSALLAYDIAQEMGARFLLRLDDIDTARCSEAHARAICDDLAWLGLRWETPVRRQSEHFPAYREAAQRLRALGLLYPCFASRKDIAEAVAKTGKPEHDPDGAPLYPGLYRDAAPDMLARLTEEGRAYALRLDMARALASVPGDLHYRVFERHGAEHARIARPARWGDAVIVRKDTPTSYHLATVVDDAVQGVTHIVRGRDLEAATDLHRLLQHLLGLPSPAYHHHRLVLDEGGRKLSKSDGDLGLAALREQGATPADIRGLVGL
ncbi:MAG: tRNA glutamyl-Q(34) synthetase GluQRS [Dichotomicrobium sp.]